MPRPLCGDGAVAATVPKHKAFSTLLQIYYANVPLLAVLCVKYGNKSTRQATTGMCLELFPKIILGNDLTGVNQQFSAIDINRARVLLLHAFHSVANWRTVLKEAGPSRPICYL